jgi:DNA-directed RNA polymerase subunit M/transcription elongation factor TFIIS
MTEARVLHVRCGNCNTALRVKTRVAERTVTCPKCNSSVTVSDATASESLATNEPNQPDAEERLKYGEKNRCPKCGSDRVRRMSAAELQEFYGGNPFVLSPPRKCSSCGHGYEAIPSAAGCYTMMALSALGVLVGAGFVVLGILAPFIVRSDDKVEVNPLWVIGRSIIAVLFGGSLIYGSFRGFSKYRGHLQRRKAEPGPPADGGA